MSFNLERARVRIEILERVQSYHQKRLEDAHLSFEKALESPSSNSDEVVARLARIESKSVDRGARIWWSHPIDIRIQRAQESMSNSNYPKSLRLNNSLVC